MAEVPYTPEELAEFKAQEPFHKAVGAALDAWSQVEQALEDFFVKLAGLNWGSGHIIMALIVSFKARMQVCNNLVPWKKLNEEQKSRWRNLYNRMAREYSRRNQLAHFSLVTMGDDDTKLTPYFTLGSMFLNQPRTSKIDLEDMATLMGMPIRLSVREIDDRMVRFALLSMDVQSLTASLKDGKLEPLAKVPQRYLDLVRERDNPSGPKPKDKKPRPRSSRG